MLVNKEHQVRQLWGNKAHYDAAVVFGYGPVLEGRKPNYGRLNKYGRINALATGMLYEQCNIDLIIPTGGQTGGKDKPSEAKLIADIVKVRFSVSKEMFILEEQATNTILNVVYAANIVDGLGKDTSNLLLVGLGFHLPRIITLCSTVGLDGTYVAAEEVVKLRSDRHHCLILELLQPKQKDHAQVLAQQERWLRAIREVPEYWLPQMALIESTNRLRQVLKNDTLNSFLKTIDVSDPDNESPERLRQQLHSIQRVIPE